MEKLAKKLLPILVTLVMTLLPVYLLRFTIGPLPSTALEVLLGLTVVVWLFAKPDWRKLKQLYHAHKSLAWAGIIFVLAATGSVFIADSLSTAAGLWKAYFIEPILFFIVIITGLEKKHMMLPVIGLTLSALVVAAHGIAQFYWFPDSIPNEYWRAIETRRAVSVFEFPNAVGLFLAPIIALSVGNAVAHWKHRVENLKLHLPLFIFHAVTIALSLWAIVLAESTGALAGLLGTGIVFGLIIKKTRILTTALIILAGVTIPFTPLAEPIQEEVLLQNYSGTIRLQMWNETLEQLETTPLFGNGLGDYQVAVAPFHKFDWAEIYLYPHNVILNFWTETGLIGMLAFVALLAWGFARAWKAQNIIPSACAAALLVMAIHGLVDVPYLKNDLAIMFWFILALLVMIPGMKSSKA